MSYLAISLDDSTYEALRDVAARKGKSVPEIIRDALELYLRLATYTEQPPRPVKSTW